VASSKKGPYRRAVAVRAPPPAELADAFVTGAKPGAAGAGAAKPAASEGRADGRKKKTLYLMPEIARRLEMQAVDTGENEYDIVEQALDAFLPHFKR
jgi:hypothetical protein